MNSSKRAKRLLILGAVVVNSAAVFTIINREKNFDVYTGTLAFLVMNGMFAGFFWAADTYLGSADLKDIVENKKRQDPWPVTQLILDAMT